MRTFARMAIGEPLLDQQKSAAARFQHVDDAANLAPIIGNLGRCGIEGAAVVQLSTRRTAVAQAASLRFRAASSICGVKRRSHCHCAA